MEPDKSNLNQINLFSRVNKNIFWNESFVNTFTYIHRIISAGDALKCLLHIQYMYTFHLFINPLLISSTVRSSKQLSMFTLCSAKMYNVGNLSRF